MATAKASSTAGATKGGKGKASRGSPATPRPAPKRNAADGLPVDTVFQQDGHEVCKIPRSGGYVVTPERLWFENLRAAKGWLRKHKHSG